MSATEIARWHVLIVDDEPLFGRSTATLLQQNGYAVTLCENGESGLKQLAQQTFHLVIADLNMPGNMNLEFLTETRAKYPSTPTIVLTGRPTLPSAIESVRLGIHDYLLKPIALQDLLHSMERALPSLEPLPLANNAFDSILGKSDAIESLKELALRVACSNANVLITGESGTDKEILARAIHASSPRQSSPLVTIDCSTIPENLLESMLFGHVKGAFTGATHDRNGLLATADKGTVLLDEIGELPLALQAKLLRVIQFGTFLPIGGNLEVKVNVRVISTTNRQLSEETLHGRFRQDLFYRLAVLQLNVPPLRQRVSDIPILAHYDSQLPLDGTQITAGQSDASLDSFNREEASQNTTREKRMEAVDRDYLDKLLKRHKGNVSRAAREARLTRQGLHKALVRLGLNAQDYRQP